MKKSNFITGTFIATLSVILIKILGMLYVVPFYIIVGSKGGALYSYAYNIYLIFLSISSAGIPGAISKIISEYNAIGNMEAKTKAYKIGRRLVGYISLAAFVLLFIFAEEIGAFILGDLQGGNTIKDVAFVVRCVSVSVLIIPYLSIARGYLEGHNFISASSTSNLLEQIVRIFVILCGSYLAYNIFNSSLTLAVGIAVSGSFFGGLVAYFYLLRKISTNKKELNLDEKCDKDKISNKKIAKKIIKYAIPSIIVNLINSVYSFSDMVIVIRALDHLGYSAHDVEFISSAISTWGSKICVIVNSIAMGMIVSLIPAIVEAFATKDWDNLNKRINKSIQIVFFVSLPLTLGLAILSVPVWTIFYNINHYGGEILRILVFNSLMGNISMIVSTILMGCNKFKAVYLVNIFGCLFNAMLDIPMIYLFNYMGWGAELGAPVASFIGYSVSVYIGIKAINSIHKVNYKGTIIAILKSLVPASVMVGVLIILNNYLPFNIYSRISSVKLVIIDTIVGGIIYVGLSFVMKIPQHIFGIDELNKILKKLTFGKFKIKDY